MFGSLGAVGRLTDIIERLLNDSGLRQKFEEKGEVAVKIRVEEYDIGVVLRRVDE